MPVERAPARNGALPVLGDGEEIRHSEQLTRLFANTNLEGEGILHLTTRRLVWLCTSNPAVGYAIDYPFITLHAVSRDKSAWPEPCLYCQLRTEDAGDDEGEDEEPDVPELRFVPAEPAHLQTIFLVFSEMSALNPDPADPQAEDSSSDDEEGDETAATGLGVMWNADSNDAAMEDAEEDEEEEEEEEEEDEAMGVEVK